MQDILPISVYAIEENRKLEQYFFTPETVDNLVELCYGKTACLCMPTVAERCWQTGKEAYLFDADQRLCEIYGDNPQVMPYDMTKPMHLSRGDSKLAESFRYSFDSVLVDPPFGKVDMEKVAANIACMLKTDYSPSTQAYLIYPRSRFTQLSSVMERFGMAGEICDMRIAYQNPPRIVKRNKDPITLFRFIRV